MTGSEQSPLGIVLATSPQLTTALLLGKFPYTAPTKQKKARTLAKGPRAYEPKTMFPTSLTAASVRWQLPIGISGLAAPDPSICLCMGHCSGVAL
jgi:hypothetical protein